MTKTPGLGAVQAGRVTGAGQVIAIDPIKYRRDFAMKMGATQALDPLVEAFPSNAEYYKARGVARLQLREFRAAKGDLEKYLKCSPEAEDKAEVTKQLEAIHRWLGRLN